MYLKRVYDRSGDEPVATHVKVLRASDVQKISTGMFDRLLTQGLASVGDGVLTLKTAEGEEPLRYRVVAGPGYYCCHDNKPLGGEAEAKAYVEEHFAGEESPDPNNPSGYRLEHAYTCVRIKEGEELTPAQAERAVQKQRREALKRIGDKYRGGAGSSSSEEQKEEEGAAPKRGRGRHRSTE